MEVKAKNLVMGLDMGTSSIKLLLLNLDTNSIELDLRKSTLSAKIRTENELFNEQDVEKIVTLLAELLTEIPAELIERIRAVQICGQMHGLVLWNKESKSHTQLITWQDLRCDKEFLRNLPVKSMSDLSVGFGGGSLFWLELNGVLKQKPHCDMNSAGTIADFVTFLMSGKLFMSIQNALGWGFFDVKNCNWQKELLEYPNFPTHLLPKVREPGFKIADECIFQNVPTPLNAQIFAALGDLQCSVYPCFERKTDCVVNMSTSGQVCMPIDKIKFEQIKSKLPKSVAVFQYFGEQVLLVSASLNGGNVLENFIDTIVEWSRDLCLIEASTPVRRDLIWQRLIELALREQPSLESDHHLRLESATFYGERHAQDTFGTLSNIRHNNAKLGQVFDSLCAGLIKNLSLMFDVEFLARDLGCQRVVAVGGAFVKNAVLRKHLERVFSRFEIVYQDSSDAALGAAYFLRDTLKK